MTTGRPSNSVSIASSGDSISPENDMLSSDSVQAGQSQDPIIYANEKSYVKAHMPKPFCGRSHGDVRRWLQRLN